MVDVTFFSLGMAFMDGNAVLPLLLQNLGASGPVIGGFAMVRFLAFSLFQIFVAYGLHGRTRQKPFLVLVASVTRLPLLILPLYLWHGAENPGARSIAIAITLFCLGVWALGDGLGYVPWMEIVGRTFDARTRGRFFATTQLTSGVISVGIAACVVQGILGSPRLPFPHNYAVLALLSAIMYQISTVGVCLIAEPPAPTQSQRQLPPLKDYFRLLPKLVRDNPIFARLATIQLLLGFGSAASPFYVLHATERFHLADSWGGRYQVMQAIGVVALMPAWAFLSEKRGPATAVRAAALACLATPLVALTLGTLSPWIFSLVFLLMGGSLGWGLWITFNHYLLSHVPEDERSLFVALFNLLFVPSALYPVLGGLFVQNKRLMTVASVPVLLLLTAAVIGIGFLMTFSLPPPAETESH